MIAFGLNSLSKFSTISNLDLISLSSFRTSNWHLTGKRLISDWDQNIGRVYSDGIILIYGSQLDQCFSYGSLIFCLLIWGKNFSKIRSKVRSKMKGSPRRTKSLLSVQISAIKSESRSPLFQYLSNLSDEGFKMHFLSYENMHLWSTGTGNWNFETLLWVDYIFIECVQFWIFETFSTCDN